MSVGPVSNFLSTENLNQAFTIIDNEVKKLAAKTQTSLSDSNHSVDTTIKNINFKIKNLNEFYKKWNLYQPLGQVNGGWSQDSTVMWEFEAEWGDKMAKMYLPYGGGSKEITFYTDHAEPYPFTANAFKVKFRPMGRSTNNIGNVEFAENFTVNVDYCEGDTVGISNPKLNLVSVYPNPSNLDQIQIKGMQDQWYAVSLLSIQGKVISSLSLNRSNSTIPVSELKSGIYWIQIKDPVSGKTQTLKWIKS